MNLEFLEDDFVDRLFHLSMYVQITLLVFGNIELSQI